MKSYSASYVTLPSTMERKKKTQDYLVPSDREENAVNYIFFQLNLPLSSATNEHNGDELYLDLRKEKLRRHCKKSN